PWRQHIDEIDVAGKLAVLLLGDAARDKNAEMADGFVNSVHDRLSVGPDLVDVAIKIEDPAECLLRRSDVVALRAEHDDGRTDVAEVDDGAVRGLDATRREMIADEELIDNELDLLSVEVDVATPPPLELEIAVGFGVDLRKHVVLFGPKRVRRV